MELIVDAQYTTACRSGHCLDAGSDSGCVFQ